MQSAAGLEQWCEARRGLPPSVLAGGLDCAGLLSLLVRQLEQQQAEAAQGEEGA